MEEVQTHHANLLSQLYGEVLVTGNFTEKVGFPNLQIRVSHHHQEAISLASLMEDQLQYQVLPPVEIPVPRSLVIPMGMRTAADQNPDSQQLTPIR